MLNTSMTNLYNSVPLIVSGIPRSGPEISAWDIVQFMSQHTNAFLYYAHCKLDHDRNGGRTARLTGCFPQKSVYNRLVVEELSLTFEWRERNIQLYVKANQRGIRPKLRESEEFALRYDRLSLGNLIHKHQEFMPRNELPQGFMRVETYPHQCLSIYFSWNNLSYRIDYAFKNIPKRLVLMRNHEIKEASSQASRKFVSLLLPVGLIPRVYVQDTLVDPNQWSLYLNWTRLASNIIGDSYVSAKRRVLEPRIPHTFMNELGRCSEHLLDFTLYENGIGSNDAQYFEAIFECMDTYGLIKRESEDFKLPRIPINAIPSLSLAQSGIPFVVLFQLLSMVNQFTVSEFDITKEIVDKIKSLPESTAEAILESIKARGKQCLDFAEELDKAIKELDLNNNAIQSSFRGKDTGINNRRIRKIIVTPTKLYLSGPQLEMTNRIIRTYKTKTDHFVRVTFADEDFQPFGHDATMFELIYKRIRKFLDLCIDIAGHEFEFLHYSNSQLRTQGCWFFLPTDDLTPQKIRSGMGVFSGILNPAKCGSRMAQCFSSTTATGTVKAENVVLIEDVERNGHVFSDGVGRISKSLNARIHQELKKYIKAPQRPPSAYQFRMGGCKGVLCLDPTIPDNQIHVRPSQRKFNSEHYAIEICRCSFFSPGYLNRQVIMLLESLGVSKRTFEQLAQEMKNRLSSIFEQEENARQVLAENEDEFGISSMLISLVDAGFFAMKEPFVINLLRLFYYIQLRELKQRTRLHVPKSCMLLGVLDETGTLPPNHIFVQYTNPVTTQIENVTGEVIVNRAPCLHPGDVQKAIAANVEDYPQLAHLVDVVVFNQQDDVPLPMKIAGGDLDGDVYLVIWDERLLQFTPYPAMDYTDNTELRVKEQVNMNDIKNHFINYLSNNNLGMIANTWLAKADESNMGALDPIAIKLSHLHSDAVDFPKRGIPAVFSRSDFKGIRYPDYMEKKHAKVRASNKAIGMIYRSVSLDGIEGLIPNAKKPNRLLCVDGAEQFMEEAHDIGRQYAKDIYGLMRQYSIGTEYELISGYMIKVVDPSLKRKPQDIKDQIMDTVSKLKRHYRKMFYELDFPQGVSDAKILNADVLAYQNTAVSGSRLLMELPSAYYQRASAWYQVVFKHQDTTQSLAQGSQNPEDEDVEERSARYIRAKKIQDSVDADLDPRFAQKRVPEIPVSFGWLMYDVLCSMVTKQYMQNETVDLMEF